MTESQLKTRQPLPKVRTAWATVNAIHMNRGALPKIAEFERPSCRETSDASNWLRHQQT
ncbi:MAG: hypothetical protein U0903_05305 [Planctomycetales bacterium]